MTDTTVRKEPQKETRTEEKVVRKRKKVRRKRKSEVQPRIQIEKVIGYLFAGLMFFTPFLAGTFDTTAHRETALTLLRACCVSIFILLGISLIIRKKPVKISLFFGLLVVFSSWLLFQLLPLPGFLLKMFSWTAHDLYQANLADLGPILATAWRPISLDVSVSGSYFANISCFLGIFFVTAVLMPRERRFREILNVLWVTAGVLGILGLVHFVMGASRMYGVIPLAENTPRFFSTFHSPEELAAFIGISILVLLSMSAEELSKESRKRNKRYFLMFLYLVVVFMLNASHSANIALVLASAFLLWKFLKRNKERLGVLAWGQFAIIATASLLVFVVRFLLNILGKTSIPTTSLGQQGEIWGDSLRVLGNFPFSGMGFGNFSIAHGIFRSSAQTDIVNHPDNFIFQLFAELGIPAGVLLLLLVLWVVIDILRNKQMRRIEMGMASSLIFLLVFNLWDSNLNSFAIALPFTFILAVMARRRGERSHGTKFLRKKLELPVGLAVAMLGLLSFFVLFGTAKAFLNNPEKARIFLALHAAEKTPARSVADIAIRQALHPHPLDWRLYRLAAQTYSDRSENERKQKIAFLEKAIHLNPLHSPLHLQLGIVSLKQQDRKKALAAFRKACAYSKGKGSLRTIWNAMLENGLNAEALVEVTPDQAKAHRNLVFYLVDLGLTNGLEALLRETSEGALSNDRAVLLAKALIAEKNGDFNTLKMLANRLSAEFSGYQYGYALKAMVFLEENDLEAAKTQLEKGEKKRGRSSLYLTAKYRYLLKQNDDQAAESTLKRMEAIYFRNEVFKPRRDELAAEVAEARGDVDSAVQLLRDALKAGRNQKRLLNKIRELETRKTEGEPPSPPTTQPAEKDVPPVP